MATIHDVAKHAGVSATTAKRAIRQPKLLAPQTLERVRRAIEELHYEPDQLASALRSGQNNTIGLVVGSIVEPFFAQLTRTIGRATREKGYTLIIADSEYDAELELQQLKRFYGNRVGGLIIRSGYGESNLEYLLRMQQRGTAIVEVDHFYPGSSFSHVMLDNEKGVIAGVEYLVNLGHKRIAALGTYDPIILSDERSQAFPKAMQAAGLSVPQAYQRVIRPTQEEAYQLTHYLMSLDKAPTAIFALTGNEAIGAFRALRELGLKIPQDISLLSFDNYPWTSLVEPPIDVIEQPTEDMGLATVEIVLAAIEKQAKNEPVEIIRKRFPGRLIKRGSCAAPRS